MLGAHFDSWQAGTGATDNAAGCAVVMEAMRILGGYGYTKEFPVERFYRDAPLMLIGEGTEAQKDHTSCTLGSRRVGLSGFARVRRSALRHAAGAARGLGAWKRGVREVDGEIEADPSGIEAGL